MTRDMAMAIPLQAHFVWFGAALPWVNVLAVRSAAERGGFDRVVLHHDEDLTAAAHYRALADIPGVELRRLDVGQVIERCGRFSAALSPIFERLPAPAMRADLVRLAILYAEGGVYLDIDTVTVRSLRALCAQAEAFCGDERIVFPAAVRRSWNPGVHALAALRNGVRELLSHVPGGWAAFRAVEGCYPRAANNAVLASAPAGRFVTRALARLCELPPEVQTRRCGIGPHLVQDIAPELAPPALVVHPPPVFYPLGPEISRHWFHVRGGAGSSLAKALLPDTHVVHWYGSLRTRVLASRIDPDYVRAHAACQLFSALALPFA
jgi:hypothetical protein